MQRDKLRFLRPGAVVELSSVDPNETLLDYLRLREGQCGTKEGCAEGDCGACTVVLGTRDNGRIRYRAVNSCIQLLGMVDGKLVLTVEDLTEAGGGLHPVQRALVDHHGSQCGFCTPGFVMSLFALYHCGERVDRARVDEGLAGNLCRCTGYRPIVDAALACCTGAAKDAFARRAGELSAALAGLDAGDDLLIGDAGRFFAAPATLPSLTRLAAEHPDATLVAGATDVALWMTKQLRDLPKLIHLGRVRELQSIEHTDGQLCIGGGVTLADAQSALRTLDPDVDELLRRFGSAQVRAAGTLGGNIANGSPIGDMPPLLIALDARIELRHGDSLRTLAIEDFFVDYAKQDRAAGEVLTRVLIPLSGPGHRVRCFKLSKRFDQDISAVMGAFRFSLDGQRIEAARIAYGGMAATPRRAPGAESAVRGMDLRQITPEALAPVMQALSEDYQPIDDMRASAAYRTRSAGALLHKALLEVAGTPSATTRIRGHRGQAH